MLILVKYFKNREKTLAENVKMIKKIEGIIKNGDYNRAAELIQKELQKSFDFKNKKSRDKYLKLHKFRIKLITQLKTRYKGKKVKAKGYYRNPSHQQRKTFTTLSKKWDGKYNLISKNSSEKIKVIKHYVESIK